MNLCREMPNGVGIRRRLQLEPFHKMVAGFGEFRIDEFIRTLEREKREGRILAFVRGLRLSAQLIYTLREFLSSTDYEVDWGHLLDEEGILCSPECDVIIHERGYVRQWNGTNNPVMDFKFINCQNAVAVLSCKSFAKSIDVEYCNKIRSYVDNILLFAECCNRSSVKRLKEQAVSAGYTGFWYLYTWDKKNSQYLKDEKQWEDFLLSLGRLLDSNPEQG